MNYQKYKRMFRRGFAAIGVLLLTQGVSSQSPGIGIYGTEIYTQGDVAIHTGMTASGRVYWHNEGTLHLRGGGIDNQSEDTLFAGGGMLIFRADTQQLVTGRPVSAASVTVRNPAGLLLGTDLSVGVQAVLDEGSVITGDNTLIITNASADALLADMSLFSTRYVQGKLSRLSDTGTDLIFPVGDTSAVYPLIISNGGSDRYFTAEYLPDFTSAPSCFPSIFYYGYTFDSFLGSGAWRVDGGASPLFGMDAYHYSRSGYDTDRDQYVLASNAAEQCSGWMLAGEPDFSTASASTVYEDFVRGSRLSKSGYYAILAALKNNLDIVNLIRLDDGSETRFVIPNVWEYGDNSLLVFSRWGTKVYEADAYDNSFDFKGSQAGTYFYVFRYTAADGKKHEVKSFVEVVK